MSLDQVHCYHHADREPKARCPECKHFYCQECVVDFKGKWLCQTCLKSMHLDKIEDKPTKKTGLPLALKAPLQIAFSLFVLWFFFYFIGKTIIRLSDNSSNVEEIVIKEAD